MTDGTNPMRELLQKQLGVDAFVLDGAAGEADDSWMDERRPVAPVPDGVAARPARTPSITVRAKTGQPAAGDQRLIGTPRTS